MGNRAAIVIVSAMAKRNVFLRSQRLTTCTVTVVSGSCYYYSTTTGRGRREREEGPVRGC